MNSINCLMESMLGAVGVSHDMLFTMPSHRALIAGAFLAGLAALGIYALGTFPAAQLAVWEARLFAMPEPPPAAAGLRALREFSEQWSVNLPAAAAFVVLSLNLAFRWLIGLAATLWAVSLLFFILFFIFPAALVHRLACPPEPTPPGFVMGPEPDGWPEGPPAAGPISSSGAGPPSDERPVIRPAL